MVGVTVAVGVGVVVCVVVGVIVDVNVGVIVGVVVAVKDTDGVTVEVTVGVIVGVGVVVGVISVKDWYSVPKYDIFAIPEQLLPKFITILFKSTFCISALAFMSWVLSYTNMSTNISYVFNP
jgi:hypothetical protein